MATGIADEYVIARTAIEDVDLVPSDQGVVAAVDAKTRQRVRAPQVLAGLGWR